MEKKDINKARQELVVKSNVLIRDTRYELSELEQKFIIYLIAKVAREDTNLQEVKVRLKDYCEIAGIEYNNGNIKHLKHTIKSIADKSWWIPSANGGVDIFRWIWRANVKGQQATIQLDSSLLPYLVELKRDFTKYELINVLLLRGKYSIRLYEIFKSYLWNREWNVSIEELRALINCDKYPRYAEFNRNILKKSIEEINKHTDINVEYEPIRYGRFIEEIEFYITEKQGIEQGLAMLENQQKRLKGR